MKKVFVAAIAAFMMVACAKSGLSTEIVGNYNGKMMPVTAIDTTDMGQMMMMSMMSAIQMEFDFQKDGNLMNKVSANGEEETFEMKWEVKGDSLFMNQGDAGETQAFGVIKTDNGYDLMTGDFKIELSRK